MRERFAKLDSNQTKVVLFSAFVGFFLVLMVAFQLETARRTQMQLIRNELEGVGRITEVSLRGAIQLVDSTLWHFANDVRRNPKLLKQNLLPKLWEIHRTFKNDKSVEVRITDAEGNITQSTTRDGTLYAKKVNIVGRDFFQYLKENKDDSVYVTEPIQSLADGRWIILLVRRLSNERGAFLGLALVSLEPPFFDPYINPIGISKNDVATIATGNKMYRSNRFPVLGNAKIGGPVELIPELQRVKKGEEHRAVARSHSVVDGVDRIFYGARIGNYPILFTVGRDVSSRMAAWRWSVGLESFVVLVFLFLELIFVVGYIRNSVQIRAQVASLAGSAKLVALGEMAGSVGHEINNPLAVIRMNGEQIKDLLSEPGVDLKLITTRIDKVLHMAERISRIVLGLKKFARHEQFTLNRVSAKKVVEESLEISAERFRSLGVELQVAPVSEEIFVNADEVQLMQVIVNLLNNAFDAVVGKDKAWVKLEVKNLSASVELSVTDCGLGIPKEVATKMMQPFFTTKEIGKGTGLGLSVSKGIIENHHGRFFYDEKSPHTRFVIELPRANTKELPKAA